MMRLIFSSFILLICFSKVFSQKEGFKHPLPYSLNYTNLKITDSPKKIRDSCLTFPLEYGEDSIDYLACLNTITIDYFYPIGWSRTGAFAYVQLVDIDGELPTYSMKIVNHQIEATSVSTNIPTGFTPVEDFDGIYDFWMKNQDDINSSIKLHNIVSQTIVYKPIKKLKQRSEFKLKLIPKKGNKPYGEKGTFVYQYEIKLNLGKGKERSLCKYEYRSKQRKIDDIKIAGIIKSPFQKKAILVLSSREWVSGANQNLTFKLIVINW